MKRNHQLESDILLAATIDRKLANMLHKPDQLRSFFNLIDEKGTAVSADGLLKLHPDKSIEVGLPGLNPWMDMNQLHSLSNLCGIMLTSYNGGVDQIVNGYHPFYSRVPALRLMQYPFTQGTPRGTFNQADISTAHQIASSVGITGGWDKSWSCDLGPWQPSQYPVDKQLVHSICDLNGIIRAQFVIVSDTINYSYMVLPVTPFSHPKFRSNFLAFTPPEGPHAFFNEHLLTGNPWASVVLTTDIQKAINTPIISNTIYLANIGHTEWLRTLDYSALRGRNVVIESEDSWENQDYTIKLIERLNANKIEPTIEGSIERVMREIFA